MQHFDDIFLIQCLLPLHHKAHPYTFGQSLGRPAFLESLDYDGMGCSGIKHLFTRDLFGNVSKSSGDLVSDSASLGEYSHRCGGSYR